MRMAELIEKKRDGLALSTEEIYGIIRGYVQGTIPDYQISALCMAIYYRGMTSRETLDLTMAMAESGEQVEIRLPDQVIVDKHSSGGVGDKTTLIIAPLVAACGVPVAKMSGRGLGHTGGTIDKLSAIPGFRTELPQEEFIAQVKAFGLAIIAQSLNLVPADKKLYALRDVTATVDSIPLIASSIMSKKIASGAGGIVLDVKYGSGAFMPTLEKAEELAKAMVDIGKSAGRNTVAVLSDMEEPLGRAVGNSLEVLEAIECLQGNGPQDLLEVCMELASWMLVVGGKTASVAEAGGLLKEALDSGLAWEKFLRLIQAQGGDVAAVKAKNLALSPYTAEFKAPEKGCIQKIDARKIGVAAMILGAGRENKDSEIDLGAGIILLKKSGEWVESGEALLRLYTSDPAKIPEALAMIAGALKISNHDYSPVSKLSRVIR